MPQVKPKISDKRAIFPFRFGSEELREAVRDRARVDGISQNALITKAIIEYLKLPPRFKL